MGFAEYEVTVYNHQNQKQGHIMVSADNAVDAKAKARETLVKQGVDYKKLTAKGYW